MANKLGLALLLCVSTLVTNQSTALGAVPGETVVWGAITERQKEVLRDYAEAFWVAWDADQAGEPAEFNFAWPADVQPGDGFDPFYLSADTLSAVYADRLVMDSGSYTYDIYDLMRDDPEVFEAFRHHTLTGELVTPVAQPQAALRHLLLQMLPPSQISELDDDGEDPCTDVYYVEATGSLTVTGSTMSSEIDVMKQPKPCPPTGGGGPPTSDVIVTRLQQMIDQSKLWSRGGDLSHEREDGFMNPGFDCDDFATAFAHWVERHFPSSLGTPKVWSLWLNWWGDGHVVVVVEVGGQLYVVDPSTGNVRGPFSTTAEAVAAAWSIMDDEYFPADLPDYLWESWRLPDDRPFGEPGPWHTDPEELDRFRDITENDPIEYMPVVPE